MKLKITDKNGKTIEITEFVKFEVEEDAEDAETAKEWWEDSIFDVGDLLFYSITAQGEVVCNNVAKEKRKEFGNACLNRKYMEGKAKRIRLFSLLYDYAKVVNEGWTPTYHIDSSKWYIYYDIITKKWEPAYRMSFIDANSVCFKSKELAEKAIEEIIIPFEEKYGKVNFDAI